MKRILFACMGLLPLALLGQSNPFTVKGKLGKLNAPAQVYLTYREGGQMVKDSAQLKNGVYQFQGEVSSPVKATLTLDPKGEGLRSVGRKADVFSVYLDKGTINISAKDSIKNSAVKGSPINADYGKYTAMLSGPQRILEGLDEEWYSATEEQKKDPALRTRLMEKHGPAAKEKEELQRKYIQENPKSYFSLLALREIAGSGFDPAEVEPVFLGLSEEVRNSESGKGFAQLIHAAKVTSIGSVAPDFTQNDTAGKAVSLSDFRGKYVLLDFWASWCGPCRAENPNVVKAFENFQDKNFTILGISLDMPGKQEAWLQAIHKDGLTWTQVSDLKFWDNEVAKLYGVRGIPQNYLLDPTGKIIAKNLRGEELQEKLGELLD